MMWQCRQQGGLHSGQLRGSRRLSGDRALALGPLGVAGDQVAQWRVILAPYGARDLTFARAVEAVVCDHLLDRCLVPRCFPDVSDNGHFGAAGAAENTDVTDP